MACNCLDDCISYQSNLVGICTENLIIKSSVIPLNGNLVAKLIDRFKNEYFIAFVKVLNTNASINLFALPDGLINISNNQFDLQIYSAMDLETPLNLTINSKQYTKVLLTFGNTTNANLY